MKEIAVAMGWSIAIATAVIESYVALHPDFADELGKKIAQLEENDSRIKL